MLRRQQIKYPRKRKDLEIANKEHSLKSWVWMWMCNLEKRHLSRQMITAKHTELLPKKTDLQKAK